MLRLIKKLTGKMDDVIPLCDYSKRLCACPDDSSHRVGFWEERGRLSVTCIQCFKQSASYSLKEEGIEMAHTLALANWNRLSRAKIAA